jgi:class 3 adenylate cyclase
MARACAVVRIEGKKSEAPYLGLHALREEAKDKQNPWSAFLSCRAGSPSGRMLAQGTGWGNAT